MLFMLNYCMDSVAFMLHVLYTNQSELRCERVHHNKITPSGVIFILQITIKELSDPPAAPTYLAHCISSDYCLVLRAVFNFPVEI